MRLFSFILLCVLSCGTALSQPTLSFDGYVVQVPSYLRFNEALAASQDMSRNYGSDVTRWRLRPVLSFSESAYLSLEYEAAAAYQSGVLALLPPAGVNRRQLFDGSWDLVNTSRWHVFHSVDRLYYRQQVGDLDLTLGRQRIAWGSGRVWNPTDFFNPLNPTTFSKIEKDGIDAATVKVTLATLSDVTFVYNPRRDNPANYALRIRTNHGGFDYSGIGGYVERRVLLGGDVAGNLFDAGVRGEMVLSMRNGAPSRTFAKAVFGADYQWTPELYTLIEYHYNGEGETDPTKYDFSRVLSGEVLNVGADYLAISATYLIHPLVTTSVTCTGNLNDGSMYLAIAATYLPAEEISVTLGGQLFTGNALDEYSYYPSACYSKLELSF